MIHLTATTSTTAVSDWLKTATSPRVLHVFDQVCNLVDEDGQVISLVTPEIGKGPFSLVLDLSYHHFTDFITSESQVLIQTPTDHIEMSLTHSSNAAGSIFQVGSLVVNPRYAEFWHPRPFWETVSDSTIMAYIPFFESKLATSSPESLAQLNGRSDPIALKAKEIIPLFLAGLQAKDSAACYASARSMAGLGGGLTPAGDDFLLGAMYGLWLKNLPTEYIETKNFLGGLAQEAISRTAALSGAWLAAAAKGEAGQRWHQLIHALAAREETAVSNAIDQILGIGHTSGADALAGFLAVITMV